MTPARSPFVNGKTGFVDRVAGEHDRYDTEEMKIELTLRDAL